MTLRREDESILCCEYLHGCLLLGDYCSDARFDDVLKLMIALVGDKKLAKTIVLKGHERYAQTSAIRSLGRIAGLISDPEEELHKAILFLKQENIFQNSCKMIVNYSVH